MSELRRYLLPFLVFAIFSFFESKVSLELVNLLYAVKIILCGFLIYYLFRNYRNEIVGKVDLLSILLGVIVFIIWICPFLHLGVIKNTISLNSTNSTFYFLVRFVGSCVVIPVLEELFFRSFLMRFLINSDFWKIELGRYTFISFWGTVIVFTLLHSKAEWIVAAISGVIYGLYLIRKKDLVGCIVAHSITNLLLFIYAFFY